MHVTFSKLYNFRCNTIYLTNLGRRRNEIDNKMCECLKKDKSKLVESNPKKKKSWASIFFNPGCMKSFICDGIIFVKKLEYLNNQIKPKCFHEKKGWTTSPIKTRFSTITFFHKKVLFPIWIEKFHMQFKIALFPFFSKMYCYLDICYDLTKWQKILL